MRRVLKGARQECTDYVLGEAVRKVELFTGTKPTVKEFERALHVVKEAERKSRKRSRPRKQ